MNVNLPRFLRAALALLDRYRRPHPRVKLHDIPIIDAHAGVDLAALMPNSVPGTARGVRQFAQGAGAETAVDRDHLG